MSTNNFCHRVDVCEDEFYEIIKSLENDHAKYRKYLEPLLSGNIKQKLINKCRNICDEISRIKNYKKGMWVSIVHRPEENLEFGKAFLVFNQVLDYSLDTSKDKQGKKARSETCIFGTSQTLKGNEVYFNGLSELIMKHSLNSLNDKSVVKN